MANIGDVMPVPEKGWKRINGALPYVKFTGGGWENDKRFSSFFNGDIMTINSGGDSSNSMIIRVFCKSFRFINPFSVGRKSMKVSIDGGKYITFNTHTSPTVNNQILQWEKRFETYGYHVFEFKPDKGDYFSIDAFDIDNESTVIKPNDELVYMRDGENYVVYNYTTKMFDIVTEKRKALMPLSIIRSLFINGELNKLENPILESKTKELDLKIYGTITSFIKSKDYENIIDLAKKVDFFNITGKYKVVFQENNSLVWKAFDTGGNKISLSTSDSDAEFNEEVRLKGNSNLNTFIDKFNELKNIKFGFLLEGPQSELDKIQMQFDAHGSFKKLVTRKSINKTNLQVTTNKNVKLMKTNIIIN